jgi:hypothetical protein
MDSGLVASVSAGNSASVGSAGSDPFGNGQRGPLTTTGTITGAPVTSACVGQTQGAQETTVDMYIMLDRSGSMTEATGAGPTKWDAIRKALTSFVQDPQSSGLGVGLQYFPLAMSGVPETCAKDRDCGTSGGECLSKICQPPAFGSGSGTLSPCLSDADCPITSAGCVPFGTCSGDATYACFNIGAGGCQAMGDCNLAPGQCTSYSSCTSGDYATPAVPIDLLPANAAPIVASLTAEKPNGLTPTSAALTGAISRASQQAKAHPDHRVIAVLATDGLPTPCSSTSTTTEAQAFTATTQAAKQGVAASPSIPTYVIGVFAPSDTTSMTNLNQLAVAGGTKTAFIVDDSQDVTQQLITALATIRSGSLACEYALPSSPTGQTIDFNQINVQFTMGNQTTESLLYVKTVDQCSKAALGWYYDVDPSTGGTPTKINVCPATCDTLRAATGATIQIRLGCATEGPS